MEAYFSPAALECSVSPLEHSASDLLLPWPAFLIKGMLRGNKQGCLLSLVRAEGPSPLLVFVP